MRDGDVGVDELRRRAFGNYLRAHREALGWNQEQAAHELGMSQGNVSLWERGEVMTYKPDDLRRWARVLRRPVTEVLASCGFLRPSEVLTDEVMMALPVSPDQIALMRLPPDLLDAEADYLGEMIASFRRWQDRHDLRPGTQSRDSEFPTG